MNRTWTALLLVACRRDPVQVPSVSAEAALLPVAVIEASTPDAPVEIGSVSEAELATFLLARIDAGPRPRVEQHDTLGSRMAVFVTVAVEPGYSTSCRGFQAIVRHDASGLAIEAIGAATLVDCDNNAKLQLAPLGDTIALLLPVSAGTGEDGDAASDWQVYVPDGTALRKVGRAGRWRSAGNGTTTRGGWFGNMEATIVADAGTLTTDETWRFEHYDPVKPMTPGPTKHVVRTYTLADGGLVRSPSADPTR